MTLPLFAVPASFTISCSNSTSSDTRIKEADELESFLGQNGNGISSKNVSNVKNFVKIDNWKNVDDLCDNVLSVYFTINDTFKEKLKENKNAIYNKIKRIVLQPKKGSRELKILFYLNKTTSDLNVVSTTVSDALSSNFSYQYEVTVSENPQVTFFDDKKQFDETWNKWNKSSDKESLKKILINGFNISTTDANKIANNTDKSESNKYFTVRTSSYYVTVSITEEGIKNGCMFSISGSNSNRQELSITSNYLVNTN